MTGAWIRVGLCRIARMARGLIIFGIALIVIGLAWPWISKLGLFRLPGDLVFERNGFRFYFPITSMVLLSLGVSLLFWLFRR